MPQTKTNTRIETSEEEPRIEPVENPDSLKLKLAYWFTEKQMGKVITPLKVVQARMPDTLSLAQKFMKIEQNLSLSDELVFYIKSYVATLNGCSFCIDIAKADAEEEMEIEKYEALMNYESTDAFSESEKAALAYVEEAARQLEVSDEVFERLQELLTDEAVLYSDGGGKVTAARKPIDSMENVAKFLVGIAEKNKDRVEIERTSVNRRPGYKAYIDGVLHSIWSFDIRGRQIKEVYAILNPEKLPSS